MILSNVAIYEALDRGRIILSPEPSPRHLVPGQNSPFDTHSVDVTLAKFLSIPKKGIATAFDFHQPDAETPVNVSRTLESLCEPLEIDTASGFTLKPQHFILGQTREELTLPIDIEPNRILKRCIAARFEGKSSRARAGILVHFTAPTIHPGFSGNITLEMINLGAIPFTLREGMAIGQLIFEEVDGLPVFRPSQFQGQTRPVGTP